MNQYMNFLCGKQTPPCKIAQQSKYVKEWPYLPDGISPSNFLKEMAPGGWIISTPFVPFNLTTYYSFGIEKEDKLSPSQTNEQFLGEI